MENGQLNLEGYLMREGVWYRILSKASTVHTADASKVTGIPLKRITKSLVFKADGRPVLGVVPGDSKVDLGKLAKTLGADKVELVPFDVAQDFSGYPPGGTPPVHHANISKVVFDSELMRFDTIFGGGGTRDKLIEIRVDDAVRLSQAVVADISRK